MRLCLFFIAVMLGSASAERPTLINLEKAAEKLMFPKEGLAVRDITAETRRQKGDGIILAEELIGKAPNTFHPMSFVVARPGTFMSEELVRKADAAIEASKDRSEPPIKRFDLADGSWGYLGLEGMGPGGALFALTFTDSKKIRDVKITLACSFEKLTVVPGGESYGKQFSGEVDGTPAMLEIMQDVIVAAQNLQLPTDAK